MNSVTLIGGPVAGKVVQVPLHSGRVTVMVGEGTKIVTYNVERIHGDGRHFYVGILPDTNINDAFTLLLEGYSKHHGRS